MSDKPINHLIEDNEGLAEECRQLQSEIERLRGRVAELTEMFAQGFDADGDPDEWRERAMKSIAGGLPSSNAFIKRRQADAILDWLHGDENMGGLDDYARRLHQQADEAEKAGGDENVTG